VVAVAYRVLVAHPDDRDRRQHGAAVLGQPQPLPAAARAEAGRNAPSNSFARLGSTVPAIASIGISRTARMPARCSDRSSYTARRPRAAGSRRSRRTIEARRRARASRANARSASIWGDPVISMQP
jgi:hypothetical protein